MCYCRLQNLGHGNPDRSLESHFRMRMNDEPVGIMQETVASFVLFQLLLRNTSYISYPCVFILLFWAAARGAQLLAWNHARQDVTFHESGEIFSGFKILLCIR